MTLRRGLIASLLLTLTASAAQAKENPLTGNPLTDRTFTGICGTGPQNFPVPKLSRSRAGYRAALRPRATTLVSTQIADRYSGSMNFVAGRSSRIFMNNGASPLSSQRPQMPS